MSAIFGIINKKGQPVDPAAIRSISTVLSHRTHDGIGIWKDEHVVLGHCKLAMNNAERLQSMPLVKDDLVITADIRIDNRSFLLQQTGAPKDVTDIVLLWHAWLKWNEQCVKYMEGEYAICIWNLITQQCFIATDHIGFRPVYYYNSPDIFIFCSEQKGVQAVKQSPYLFNEVSLIEYYFRQSAPTETYDTDIYALCGGNTLQLTVRGIVIRKYWTPGAGKYAFRKDQDWHECLKELIWQAVSNRLNTDKPVGITLSGGLDSSSLACVLSEVLLKQNKPLYAFSAVLSDDHHAGEEDERNYIDIIGRHCPNLVQTYVTAAEYGPFDNIVQAFERDETFPNVFYYMDYAILEAAAKKHIGVLYTGYGGDHWVSWKGNPVIHQMIRRGRIISAAKLIKAFSKRENKSLLEIIRREYVVQSAKKKEQEVLEAPYLQELFFKKHNRALSFRRVEDITAFMCNNLQSGRTGIFPAMLAKRNERYGMQSAVPLLDKRVMEFMMDVPSHLFIYDGCKRSLIRHTMQGVVPPEVLWRHDKGMYSPDYVSRVLKHQAVIQQVSESDKYAIGFKHYLSRDGLTFDHKNKKDTSIIRTTQAVIISTILSDLQQKGYVIPS
jgi:asparagine synthase (glutamine-hydrolysing)